jgi:hypothetical protein
LAVHYLRRSGQAKIPLPNCRLLDVTLYYGGVCLLISLTEVVIALQTHMNFITSVVAGVLV